MDIAILISTLVPIIVLGGFAYAGIVVVKRLKRQMQIFSRQAFGTSDLMEGFRQVEQEYSSTPKSVSAMTSLYLPKIKKDFPEFQYDEMKVRAENALTSYLLAVDTMNPGAFREEGEELKDKLEMRIEMLKASGQREHFRNIKLHRTEIANYAKRNGRCIITFQTSLQYLYSREDESVQASQSGQLTTQAKYNVDLIYVQDRNLVREEHDMSLGLNCPNCGAPLSGLGSKVCEYCGTPVVELNIYAWTFSNIQEVS